MATGRHFELHKILFWDWSRILICTGLIWLNRANIILYYNAFGSFADIIIIGDQCVLIILGGHLGFGIKMSPKHNFNTRRGFVALKLVGSEVLL